MEVFDYQPKHYDITLTPNMSEFTYVGEELFTFIIDKATSEIQMHQHNLTILSCTYNGKNIDFRVDNENQRLVMTFSEAVQPGEHRVVITFSGQNKNQQAGWYRASYIEDGEKKFFLTSHFEAADARRAFPCVDNPNYKATYTIRMVVDADLDTVSNMPIESTEELGDKKKVSFMVSPRMSTYLVYFGVGHFEFLEDAYKNIQIRGVTVTGKSQYTRYAIEMAKKSLEYFEDYFGIPYPLPKVDLIADPDFAMGAMEQWGAVTFRETRLLVYEGKTSLAAKKLCAETVAHELAHMWFGNLVTMVWWDDLWLNESFATLMANKALSSFMPEWDMWTDYVTDTVFVGMNLDMLSSTHPVSQELEDVEEVDSRFDEITYDKGGSVLRMLENYASTENFRKGLQAYMQKFAYKNARGSDLWGAISEAASDLSINTIMESYLTQNGFPLITFTRTADGIKATQKHFSLLPDKKTDVVWYVPLGLTIDREQTKAVHLSHTEQVIPLVNTSMYPNTAYAGFYMSQLDDALSASLVSEWGNLSTIEKLGILHDTYILTKGCRIKVTQYLDLVNTFQETEEDPAILQYVIGTLEALYITIESPALATSLLSFCQKSIKLFGLIPQTDESTHIPSLRAVSLLLLGLLNDDTAKEFVDKAFSDFLADETTLHADIRSVVYALAAKHNPSHHDSLFQLYKTHGVEEEKTKILGSLGFSSDEKKLEEVLAFALTDEVRFVNLIHLNNAFSRNPALKKLAFNWLNTSWDILQSKSNNMGDMLLRRILHAIIPQYGKDNKEEVQEFLKKVKSPILQQAKKEVLEQMEILSNLKEFNK